MRGCLTRILSLVDHKYLAILAHESLMLASRSLCRIDVRHAWRQNHLMLWCTHLLGLSSSRSCRLIRLNLMLFSRFSFNVRWMAGIGHHPRVGRLHRRTSPHALNEKVLRGSRGHVRNNARACYGILRTSLSLRCLTGCGCRSTYHLRLLTRSLVHDYILGCCTSRLSTL